MPAQTRVVLEPPHTTGTIYHDNPLSVLHLGPPLVRTRKMGRWHRPRSGIRYDERDIYHAWCGQAVHIGELVTADTVPDGDSLCGTCEGRAVGAGHHPIAGTPTVPLLFQPESRYVRPTVCPGSGRGPIPTEYARARTMPCRACGEVVRLRAAGGPYYSTVVVERHPPGVGLVDPCPFHGWRCVRDLWLHQRRKWLAGDGVGAP